MTEPVAFDPETTPSVTLAGKQWPIPELVWRDLRKCRAELIELTARINVAIAASPAPADESDLGRGLRHMIVLERVFEDLSNEDFDRLVMGPIHAALCAAHPSLSKEELFSWRLTESERQMAWLTVRRQSLLFSSRAEGPEPGEGDGAA